MPQRDVHSVAPEDWMARCQTRGGGNGGDSAFGGENAGPPSAGNAKDDVGVASAIDVADLVEAAALLPFGERNGAESTFGIGELEDRYRSALWGAASPAGRRCSAPWRKRCKDR